MSERLEFTIAQVASAYGVPSKAIEEFLEGNEFPNAYRDDKSEWLIPMADVVARLEFTIAQVASAYGVPKTMIEEFLYANEFPNAHRDDKREWLIPIGDLALVGIGRGISRTIRVLLEHSDKINVLLELAPTIRGEGMKSALLHKLARSEAASARAGRIERARALDTVASEQRPASTSNTIEDGPVTPSASDLVSNLAQLAALHGQGALSDEEFSAAKQQIISEKPAKQQPPASVPPLPPPLSRQRPTSAGSRIGDRQSTSSASTTPQSSRFGWPMNTGLAAGAYGFVSSVYLWPNPVTSENLARSVIHSASLYIGVGGLCWLVRAGVRKLQK
jgi:hypothetical protein